VIVRIRMNVRRVMRMEKNELEELQKVLGRFTYAPALLEVLKIRDQRQKIYADDWRQQEDWELLAMLKMKVRRLQAFVIGKKDQKVYEDQIEVLRDLCNYTLFMLQNSIDKDDGEKAKR
jgi:hypothetical protein